MAYEKKYRESLDKDKLKEYEHNWYEEHKTECKKKCMDRYHKLRDERLAEQATVEEEHKEEISRLNIILEEQHKEKHKLQQRARSKLLPRIEIICKQCGNTAKIIKYQRSGEFCSQRCSTQWKRGENHPMWKGGKATLICEYCGKPYKDNLTADRKYCSNSCSAKRRVGPLNPAWQGGISFEPYCPKFNAEFKERVRAFFDYECLICGKPQAENIGITDGKHHLLGVHHVSYNKETCCDDSIPMFAPTCLRCHGRTNGRKDGNRERWQYMLSYIIQEVYDGRSYLPKNQDLNAQVMVTA